MKNLVTSSILILLLGLASMSGYSQKESLRFEHFTVENGLSDNRITALLQDSKGYIWIGTFDGLNKYDGYTFTKYQLDPFDSNSVSQNLIYTIWEDKFGSIWVGTFEGLCKLDRNTGRFTRYKPSPNAKFSDPNISAISADDTGMMWVGSASGGLCRFDRETGKFLPDTFDLGFRKLPGSELHDGVFSIYNDRDGTIWIGADKSGLHQLNLKATKQGDKPIKSYMRYQNNPADSNSLSNNSILGIFKDRTGILWIATMNGLNNFDKKSRKFKRYRAQNIPGSITSNLMGYWMGGRFAEDSKGNLWIATDNGLNMLNRERTSFNAYFPNPSEAKVLSEMLIWLVDGTGNTLNPLSSSKIKLSSTPCFRLF